MKFVRVIMLIAAAVYACSAVGQTNGAATFINIRLWRSDITTMNGPKLANDCILISADGQVRREHQFEALASTSARVYEGKLPESDLKLLDGLTSSAEFRAMRADPRGGIHMVRDGTETVQVTIIRPDGVQNLIFQDAKARQPYHNVLKPLLQWWRQVEKQKLPESKGAAATSCIIGPVMLKSRVPPPE